ncbi:MAG: transcription termination/antitermination protein NusG [Deltaproteobacteria bacterium]|jgi:transcriptional antiterminator NusG|nr:transcription termination/antitermination protein NusG [Deltaproteobacteria bacterium]MBW2475736.1 transcription termination/antitermination protein NusG [Deltaproteobacteria bacterium]MBW2504414.1 transcription termination/antitermination protein NusG [Deltaproteobacteria bacterium]MBW2520192.1 transcription termination/antitermination protein NusG [Deltaproteobacteria bacterium]
MSDKKWYGVHTYSGYENKVKLNLEERIRALGAEDAFGEILIPSETVVELKNGERRTSSRKFFPGYILVQMDLNNETWHIVKDTPKVTGFVGGGATPPPIPDDEVAKITTRMEEGEERPKPKVEFEVGETVRVVDGPFLNFTGIVEDVRPEKGKLKVMVSIFGRVTPVELEFIQVEKTS